jgi:DNA topoisomerase IA
MADLVVQDLGELVNDLNSLISAFEGAGHLQDTDKDNWGQQNANWSMGDFADNWKIHREKMVEEMKKFVKRVEQVNQAWTDADRQLHDTLGEQA